MQVPWIDNPELYISHWVLLLGMSPSRRDELRDNHATILARCSKIWNDGSQSKLRPEIHEDRPESRVLDCKLPSGLRLSRAFAWVTFSENHSWARSTRQQIWNSHFNLYGFGEGGVEEFLVRSCCQSSLPKYRYSLLDSTKDLIRQISTLQSPLAVRCQQPNLVVLTRGQPSCYELCTIKCRIHHLQICIEAKRIEENHADILPQ